MNRNGKKLGIAIIAALAGSYFVNLGIRGTRKKNGDMNSDRVSEIKESLKLEEYVQGLINSYGDHVHRAVSTFLEDSNGVIYDPKEYHIIGYPLSEFTEWPEFIEVLNEFHSTMCKNNKGWNFENTYAEVERMIKNYYDYLEANNHE